MSTTDESDSFSSLQADFERLSETLNIFASAIESLGDNLTKIQKPIENIEIEQLPDTVFLEKSPFRLQTFLVKSPCFPGIDPNIRYPFHKICSILRNYIFSMKLVDESGSIKPNEVLRKYFNIDSSVQEISYLDLLSKLKHVLV